MRSRFDYKKLARDTDDCIDHGRVGNKSGYAGGGRPDSLPAALHRRVFLEVYGYLPPVVRHICDNPRCLNHRHLVGGTQADNMQDMEQRGRARRGLRPRVLASSTKAEIKSLRLAGASHRSLAIQFNVSKGTIYNALQET